MDGEAAAASESAPPWALRLRGVKGLPASVDLPNRESTTVKELVQLVGKAAKVAARRVVIRAGFPPRVIAGAGSGVAPSSSLSSIGLADREAITVERAPAAKAGETEASEKPGSSAEAAAGPATEAKGKSPAKGVREGSSAAAAAAARRAAANGAGPSTGADTRSEPAPVRTTGAAAGTAVAPSTGPPAKRRRVKMPGAARTLVDEVAPDASAGEGDAIGRAEAGMAAAFVNAVGGARGGAAAGNWDASTRNMFSNLRKALREERKRREGESEAELKVGAALAGQVVFRALDDGTGRVEAAYKKGRKTGLECTPDIPRFLLLAVLLAVAGDPDEVSQGNLKPVQMAQVSPRMFWAVVRHGNVGPQKSFETALKELCPPVDWASKHIDHRERKTPARMEGFVSDFDDADLEPDDDK